MEPSFRSVESRVDVSQVEVAVGYLIIVGGKVLRSLEAEVV